MATVRKRSWKTNGEAKAAWLVDYTDSPDGLSSSGKEMSAYFHEHFVPAYKC
jgi:hypothetical protein